MCTTLFHAQDMLVPDSTHVVENVYFEHDTITSIETMTEEFVGGLLLLRSSIGIDDRGQPDTSIVKYTYDHAGRRVSSEEYKSYFSECLRQERIADRDTTTSGKPYYYFDDQPLTYTYYEPCLIRFEAHANWFGDMAVRTSRLMEDSIIDHTLDSIWYDQFNRPLKMAMYKNDVNWYNEMIAYQHLKGDSLQVHRQIWDGEMYTSWLQKYRIFDGDTVVVYHNMEPDAYDQSYSESYWLYNEDMQQTAYVAKRNGIEEQRIDISLDENGMVKEHKTYINGKWDGKLKLWNWKKQEFGIEVWYIDEDEVHYTKSMEQQMDNGYCKWLFSTRVPSKTIDFQQGMKSNLELTNYVEYDRSGRVVFQQNYQDNGGLSFQAKHFFSK